MTSKKVLSQAEIHLESGLHLAAWKMLDTLPLSARMTESSLDLHLRILIAEKAWQKVEILADFITGLYPENAFAWYSQAQSHCQRNHIAEAKSCLAKACQLQPSKLDLAMTDPLIIGVW